MTQSAKDKKLQEQLQHNFKAFEAKLNGHSKTQMHEVRKKAITSFNQLGIPGPKSEEYKYTQLGKVLEKDVDFAVASASPSGENNLLDDILIKDLDAHNLVFINGELSEEHSSLYELKDGVEVSELERAYELSPELINDNFAKNADYEVDPFTALNTAFTKNGAFIKIADNKVIDKPVALYYISDSKNGAVYTYPRNLLLAGKNAQADIIEVYTTVGGNSSFSNVVTEVVLEENAHITYFKLQNDSTQAIHHGTTQVYQERSSTFSSTTVALSGKMIRNNLNIVLDGEGCEANMYGLYLLKDKTHVDNHTAVDHKKANSYSNELYKGVLDDRSKGVFNGKIFVRQDAQKTNAFQSNNNILLSDDATVNTKPQLEIWADDVKCSHGCTTGQLDEEALFYLRSRGIDKTNAQAIMLYAFALEVIEKIKLDALRDHVEGLIAERFEQKG
ncbi:MAG: Fe-S cluster assembly protein SufD [Bacteroidota bacterium]